MPLDLLLDLLNIFLWRYCVIASANEWLQWLQLRYNSANTGILLAFLLSHRLLRVYAALTVTGISLFINRSFCLAVNCSLSENHFCCRQRKAFA